MELIIVLIIASFLALALGLSSLAGGRTRVRRRLARLADGSTVAIPTQESESVLNQEDNGWIVRLLAPFAGQGKQEGTDSAHQPVRQRLIQAGFRRESAFTTYMGSRVVMALAFALFALLYPNTWLLDQLQMAVLGCTAAGVGFILPGYYVDRKRNARQTEIILGLPDALDLMVVCVEAGLGINASLLRIAQEFEDSNPILSAEFELVNLEIRAGKSSAEALRALADRTGVGEVSSLVAMLVQTERFGTSLADTLRVHADAMRIQRMQRAEELAAKAPLKMLFPTAIIFFATLMVTIGPGMIQLFGFFKEQN